MSVHRNPQVKALWRARQGITRGVIGKTRIVGVA